MNIGIFSGSFNPIHIGHLMLANYITEFTEIDEIWFIVSPQNPLKEDGMLDEKIRLQMVELALKDYAKLKASDFEFSLPKPSYTINTLEALKVKYPEHEFMLIIGGDNWDVFKSWKNYDKILENYLIKVYPRLDYKIMIPTRFEKQVEILDSPIIEVSSTFIRESFEEGRDIKAFLPRSVYDFIKEKRIYK